MERNGKKSAILVATMVLVFTFCHFAPAQDSKGIEDQSIENLRNTVALFNKAFGQRDFQTITGLIDDRSIQQIGSSAKFFELVSMAWEPYPVGILKVENPQEVSAIDGKLFSALPLRMEGLLTMNKRKIVETCLLAVSADNGKTWKFVTGESFSQVFPEVAGNVKILERKEIIEWVHE